MFLTEKSLFGPIYILFSARSISDRQQSLQLFTAISVIITKPHIINRSSVHRHTPCFENGTTKHKKIAASTQYSNSKHSDLVASWGHLKKLFFTTDVKNKQTPKWSFSLQSWMSCQWLGDGSVMLRAVVLPANCNLSIRHQTPWTFSARDFVRTQWENQKQKPRSKTSGKGNRLVSEQERRLKMTSDCYEIKNTISNGAKIARHTYVVIIRVLMRTPTNTNAFNDSVKPKQRFSYWVTLFINVTIGIYNFMSILKLNIALVIFIYILKKSKNYRLHSKPSLYVETLTFTAGTL